MKKTTNYQLNQWAKTDRILMDDFNADNAKLDAALLSKLGHLQKIKEIDSPSTLSRTNPITVDLTDIDWDKWYLVAVVLPCDGSKWDTEYMYIDLQGIPYVGGTYSQLAHGRPSSRGIVFLPMGKKENPVRAICLPIADIAVSESDFRSLTSMRFIYGGGDGSATNCKKITLWGIPA